MCVCVCIWKAKAGQWIARDVLRAKPEGHPTNITKCDNPVNYGWISIYKVSTKEFSWNAYSCPANSGMEFISNAYSCPPNSVKEFIFLSSILRYRIYLFLYFWKRIIIQYKKLRQDDEFLGMSLGLRPRDIPRNSSSCLRFLYRITIFFLKTAG